MSNAIIVPDSFKAPVASAFQGLQAGDDLSGGITGGYGLVKYRGKVWSIQYQGNVMNLMRDDGDGPRGSIDVVIVKANPQMSKTFYINGWDENNNNPPDCASANGIVPDQGVPHRQSDICATCPKNAWGSAPNGGKGKACGDHRRLAVVPLPDLRNESLGGPLLLRCPAASLQDMAAFDARYKSMGYPYFTMGVKIGFDPQESYPKFTFAAIRPLTEDEAKVVIELRNSPDTARVVNEGSAPAMAQVAQQPAAFLEAPPPNAVAPQVAVRPAAVAEPAPAVAQPAAALAQQPVDGGVRQSVPAAAPEPNVQAAARPAPVTTGFGAAAPVTASPQPAPAAAAGPAPTAQPAPAPAQQAAPVKPPVAMTGFGAVTPEVTAAAPAQAVQPAATQPVAPAVQSAFEGSIDDRLNALLSATAQPAA